ncbi:hypothetical protein AMJ87_02130 [candidate division WOR_3 bacterium SM23_60]|uniref:Uncharacterized protein n=1 Tax=candidate division WOR_3 bacterium SM23_60 TaxID=1703780 RepID=A0A0S8GNA2_UNCW3|nr:MAG: hypothetical protein AMJ87_02130 [candidate division WOR_3 bacterium SM23_60]
MKYIYFIVVIAIYSSIHLGHAQVQMPTVTAVRTAEPPVIDGLLHDSCWQCCSTATGFVMVEPNPGAEVTQQTYVRVCYDDEKIYFGIHMSEDRPDALQATTNQRDGGVYMDDSFELILDTYCDRRNAYYFMSNLLGTKLDGRIIDDGRNTESNWDAHWEVKARRCEGGWEMEIAIPFSELSYPGKAEQLWGANFWRVERPHWENTSWAPVQQWCQISRYGTIQGLVITGKTKRLTILPYGAARFERDTLADSLEARAGFDIEYDVTSDLKFNTTFLPDYAQIEADPFQFNLSYEKGEELYFAEKRPFFLEGGSILTTPFQLFYTRRMNEIHAGGKLYGKIRSTELLGLAVRTKDTEEFFSVLRAKQELMGTTTLGALVTHKQHDDTVSQAAGVDFNMPVAGRFLLTTQFAATHNTGVSGDQWAGHVGIDGETSTYGAGIYAGRIGPAFSVEQGFINAYDINQQGVSGYAWHKLLQDWGWFEWIDGGVSFDVAQEIGDRLTVGEVEFWSNVVTRPRIRLGLDGVRTYERYGDTEFTNYVIGGDIETNVGGAAGIASSGGVGQLYDESFQRFHVGALFVIFDRISMFPVLQAVRFGETQWQWLINARISYQITDRAFFRIFAQSASEQGTVSSEFLACEDILNLTNNLLFGYEFAPGTILYIVYNNVHNFDTQSTNHIIVTKFTYSLKF